MGQPLDGVEAKIRQAKRHMLALDDAYGKVLEADPVQLGLSVEEERKGYYLVEVRHFPDLPPDLAAIVGDAVHCFRSALDHLIYEAGRQSAGKGSNRSQFPVADDPAGFRAQCHRISDLPGEQQAIVESVQPFNRGGSISPLLVLRTLSNADKHRALNPILTEGTYLSGSGEPFRGVNCTVASREWMGAGHRLKLGSKVARLSLVGDFTEPNVEMHGAFVPDLAFEASGDSVIETLMRIGAECLLAIRQFEPILEPLPGHEFMHRGRRRRWANFSTWPHPRDV